MNPSYVSVHIPAGINEVRFGGEDDNIGITQGQSTCTMELLRALATSSDVNVIGRLVPIRISLGGITTSSGYSDKYYTVNTASGTPPKVYITPGIGLRIHPTGYETPDEQNGIISISISATPIIVTKSQVENRENGVLFVPDAVSLDLYLKITPMRDIGSTSGLVDIYPVKRESYPGRR